MLNGDVDGSSGNRALNSIRPVTPVNSFLIFAPLLLIFIFCEIKCCTIDAWKVEETLMSIVFQVVCSKFFPPALSERERERVN